MRYSRTPKQDWTKGQIVNSGFVKGLVVVSNKIPTPKDFRPDVRILQKGLQYYIHTPYNGLEKISHVEAINWLIKDTEK